jgi:hypothetical protein
MILALPRYFVAQSKSRFNPAAVVDGSTLDPRGPAGRRARSPRLPSPTRSRADSTMNMQSYVVALDDASSRSREGNAMTNLAHRTIGDYGALGNRELELLRGDKCPDCRSKDLAPGPRGNVGQNIFCSACGAEFNIVYPRYVIWGQRIRGGRHPVRWHEV